MRQFLFLLGRLLAGWTERFVAPPQRILGEAEWLSCGEPYRMLWHLEKLAGERKLRLFGCACCRQIWDQLPEVCRRAVVVAEDFADGAADAEALREADLQARQEGLNSPDGLAAFLVVAVVGQMTAADAPLHAAVLRCSYFAREVVSADVPPAQSKEAQCALVRELFGNPFRPPAVEPAWLSWGGGAVAKMARTIYDGRRFDELPFLADALEDAGCTDADVLAHCRSGAGHVRGCWVLDALLGKG